MKNTILWLGLALGTSSVLAQDTNYFDELGYMYQIGRLPDLTKISSVAWPGRCFSNTSKNSPENSVFIIRPKNDQAGPLKIKSFEVYQENTSFGGADFFDHMKLDEVYEWMEIMQTSFKDATVYSNHVTFNPTIDVRSELKISGPYLIVKNETFFYSSRKYESVSRCYYFMPQEAYDLLKK